MQQKRKFLSALAELKAYSLARGVQVLDARGVSYGNLYDAKLIVDEFSHLASAHPGAFDSVQSPTGVALLLMKLS